MESFPHAPSAKVRQRFRDTDRGRVRKYLSFWGIAFRVGRVIAVVGGKLKDAQSLEDNAYLIEALCLGIEYLLQQHPKVGVLPSKARLLLAGQPNGEVTLLYGIPFGQLGVLKSAGVHVKEHRESKE